MQSAFILARRAARSRASILATLLALTFSACNSDELTNTTDAVTPTTTDDLSNSGDVTEEPVTAVEIPSQSLSYAGGIAFGTFHQPTSVFGTTYNGALRNIYPNELVAQLQAIRSRGGRVVLNMAGSQSRYRDRNHNFSLTMWKASIDRFKNVNITPFINDGTIIASFLIDEPHNTSRWNGKVVSYATLELMARYSKSRWPGLATVVRAYPVWLAKYSGSYRYLDGAWGQYVARFGSVSTFMKTQTAAAQRKGLSLVVGLNVLRGGPGNTRMSGSQVKSYGSALLASSLPCAFINWEYNSNYLSSSSVRDAMKYLRSKAQARSRKSCRS